MGTIREVEKMVYAKEYPEGRGPEGKQQEIGTDCCVVYSEDGDSVQAVSRGAEEARFLIIAGKTLSEPMVRDGPFVMNTQEEIEQA